MHYNRRVKGEPLFSYLEILLKREWFLTITTAKPRKLIHIVVVCNFISALHLIWRMPSNTVPVYHLL